MRIKQVFLNLSLDDLEMTSELYTEVEIKPIIGKLTPYKLEDCPYRSILTPVNSVGSLELQ